MKQISTNCILFCFILQALICDAQNATTAVSANNDDEPDDDFEQYDVKDAYCFRFTWLGSQFTNDSVVNGTCKSITNKLTSVPCRQPLVITFDGTPPNMDYLYEHHRDRVLCRRSEGHACVKYSYFFNNKLENVTYMCAKVLAINEGSVSSGCYSNSDSGYETQACMCKSSPGNYKPCNSGHTHFLSFLVALLILPLFLFNRY